MKIGKQQKRAAERLIALMLVTLLGVAVNNPAVRAAEGDEVE
jgi:hypothetical protein